MRRVDLVVTVDTAVAHLAGATGAPTLLCLPFTPDYRWALTRTSTPWYRSVTILRQPEAFAWDAVLDDVCTRVTALVKPSRLSGRVQR
jgi:ADP-heptose:LPS heptosyltransferase